VEPAVVSHLPKSNIRCKAVSNRLVRCSGLVATNDPNQLMHNQIIEIRKVLYRTAKGKITYPAERRAWFVGERPGRPFLESGFSKEVKGW
jgi:hypothetical protein